MLRRRDTASSPCDVSHRASDEPRRRMSLSSALAPSSLASPSVRRVFLRSFCARRRSVSSLNLVRVSPGAKRSCRRRAQCGVQIYHVILVGAHLRGARFPAANPPHRLGRGASPRRPLPRGKSTATLDPADLSNPTEKSPASRKPRSQHPDPSRLRRGVPASINRSPALDVLLV